MTPATDAAREARAREIAWKLVIGEKVGGGDGQTYVGRTPTVSEIEAALLAFADTEAASQPREGDSPVPMILHCPRCHVQHIDEPTPEWSNPPHRSHLCLSCGFVWRPADVPTQGVERISTAGKADTALTQRPPEQAGAVPAGEIERLRAALREAAGALMIYDGQVTNPKMAEGWTDTDGYDAYMAAIQAAAPTPPDAGIGSDGAGEMRCPACHVKFRKIDDVDAHIASLATQPGDGGRS